MKRKIKEGLLKFIPPHEPDFLILGAQKAGTTSLHYYLHQHPKLIGAMDKEVGYFSNDRNFLKGLSWYRNHFKDIRRPFSNNCMYFESTPEYLYRANAIKRIYDYNPNLKLIILLREPVSRAFSSYNMFKDFISRKNGLPKKLFFGYVGDKKNNLFNELYAGDFPSFEEVVNSELKKIENNSSLEEPSFIRRGFYYEQIKEVFKYFDRENVLIEDFRDLKTNRDELLNNVLDFIGLEKINNWDNILDDKIYNQRKYHSKLRSETKTELENFYAPYNNKLNDLLDKNYNW